MKPIDAGAFQPYWGTRREDGTSKYPLDWAGGVGSSAQCDALNTTITVSMTAATPPPATTATTPRPTVPLTSKPTATKSPTPAPTTPPPASAVVGANFGNYFAQKKLPVVQSLQILRDRGK